VKVVVFCGGRGSATLTRELLRWPEIELSLLVNAYDDGLSTGALRDFVPGMLGPSDFRKNLSYLLDPYSNEQYAMKELLELRLPLDFTRAQEEALRTFVRSGEAGPLAAPLGDLLARLHPRAATAVRQLLGEFLTYADGSGRHFDFRDCAFGNLLFAGAYLREERNFNAAALVMSGLVSSQAVLINASAGENRILVALKEDGQLLANEAAIVGPQSAVPIRGSFLLDAPIDERQWQTVADRTVEEKERWLAARESLPLLSPEACRALEQATLIIYGPGTQNSSLLPSYRIAAATLRRAPAAMKVLVLNLDYDHDIQNLSGARIVDRALACMGDPTNRERVVTHILADDSPGAGSQAIAAPPVDADGCYRGALVIRGPWRSAIRPQVHNGQAVVGRIFEIWERPDPGVRSPSLRIFLDPYKRMAALQDQLEELLEYDWRRHFRNVRLDVNGSVPRLQTLPALLTLGECHYTGVFPEVSEVRDWIEHGDEDYLATLTGDGEYRLRDIVLGVRVLEGGPFGAVYGSRTQSRHQFHTSVRAAYGERGVLFYSSLAGAFLLSVLFTARFGVIFSDPLSGFRIYSRRKMMPLARLLEGNGAMTPTTITGLLVKHAIEIAELPVHYRTFAGFTDPRWRLRRGLANLRGLLH